MPTLRKCAVLAVVVVLAACSNEDRPSFVGDFGAGLDVGGGDDAGGEGDVGEGDAGEGDATLGVEDSDAVDADDDETLADIGDDTGDQTVDVADPLDLESDGDVDESWLGWCGDGIVQPGEECDEGEENSAAPGARCSEDCLAAFECADGSVVARGADCDGTEDCADGSDEDCAVIQACSHDADCALGWRCSDVPGYEVCVPVALAETAHAMVFAYVPSGTFTQGPDSSDERSFESTLSRAYFMGRTEVTQGQWSEVMSGVHPSWFRDCGSTCPVEHVSWWDVVQYANELTDRELGPSSRCYTLSGCTGSVGASFSCPIAPSFVGYSCAGYRLPTESEWERAARGGTTTNNYWGDSTDPSVVDQYAWAYSNVGWETHPVGSRLPNAYGLYDVSGNVMEWVWDRVYPYPSRPRANYYTSMESWAPRGRRGPDWVEIVPGYSTSASRFSHASDLRDNTTGVRLARTAE